VPKLKIMREVVITCALKNIFGCIGFPRKIVYHPHLNEAIVGINQLLKPHLIIVDGLVALGKFPVKLGLTMAGKDSFSVDWVAAKVMGYNPSKIKFLQIAEKARLGNPKEITILGEDIEKFKKIFPRNNFFFTQLWFKTQLNLLSIYNKVVGDTIPKDLEKT
jgi:uncharacterized protein (DUF362 family)